MSNRNSWWRQRRGGSISENLCCCFLLIQGWSLFYSWLFCLFCRLFSLFYPWPHLFSFDKLIPGCQWVEIEENCERFVASTKTKFLLCGKSEEAHGGKKNDLTRRKLPSGSFGENAAWWWCMALAFNLSSLMKNLVLRGEWTKKRMKAIRY